jgi:hypothetical protein
MGIEGQNIPINNNQGICKFILQLNAIWFDAKILNQGMTMTLDPKNSSPIS